MIVDCPKEPLHQYRPELISSLIFVKTLGMEMSFSSSMNSVACMKLNSLFEMIAFGLSEDKQNHGKHAVQALLLPELFLI